VRPCLVHLRTEETAALDSLYLRHSPPQEPPHLRALHPRGPALRAVRCPALWQCATHADKSRRRALRCYKCQRPTALPTVPPTATAPIATAAAAAAAAATVAALLATELPNERVHIQRLP
jgi:hypothetical protein